MPADPNATNRGAVAALVFIVLLVGGLYWVMHSVVSHNAMQDCLDSGRRDCAERVGTP